MPTIPYPAPLRQGRVAIERVRAWAVRVALPRAVGSGRAPLASRDYLMAFEHIAATGAAAIVQAEAPRCGGVTGWLRLAEAMAPSGVMMSPCWFHQLHMHLVPAIGNGLFVEYFHGTDVLNFDLMIDAPPRVVDGSIVIPERPGLGFDFDRDFITRHAIGAVDLRVGARP